MSYIFIALYLLAIVAANLTIATFGMSATIIVAFVYIGLDITARDKLHEAWHHNGLVWKMGALIATGSILSYALDYQAGQIALASFAAFALSAVADTLVYTVLHRQAWFVKVNGSNLVSAAVDSLVFPTLAFGGFIPVIVLGQFAAKVAGGAIWALVPTAIKSGSRARA